MLRLSSTALLRRQWLLVSGLAVAAAIVFAMTRLAGGTPPVRSGPVNIGALPLAYGPADFSGAMALANNAVALGEERVARRPQDWIYQESLARALLGRARLNLSFDDLARAGAALVTGKSTAIANSGPMLTDAVYNFTVHRSAPIPGDLAVVEGAAVRADAGDRAEAIALHGDVAFYSGDYHTAIQHYSEAARIASDPGTSFRIAAWQKKTGQFDAALASFAHAATINHHRTPQFMANVFLQSGIVELERGNWSRAEEWFQKADTVFPGYWLTEAHLVQMWALHGDMARAARGYEQIIARTAEPDVMDALAALYRAQGNAAASRQWAARSGPIWTKRLGQLPEAAYSHALEHQLVLGDPAIALDLARKNMVARPYGDSATMLGWALLANGRAAEARDVLEALEKTRWRTAQQYVALSQAYAMLGDSDRSDAARDTAISINPRSTDPRAPMIWFGHH